MMINVCRVCGYVSENSDFFANGGELGVCSICNEQLIDKKDVIQDDIQEPDAADEFVLQEDNIQW